MTHAVVRHAAAAADVPGKGRAGRRAGGSTIPYLLIEAAALEPRCGCGAGRAGSSRLTLTMPTMGEP